MTINNCSTNNHPHPHTLPPPLHIFRPIVRINLLCYLSFFFFFWDVNYTRLSRVLSNTVQGTNHSCSKLFLDRLLRYVDIRICVVCLACLAALGIALCSNSFFFNGLDFRTRMRSRSKRLEIGESYARLIIEFSLSFDTKLLKIVAKVKSRIKK